MHNDKKWLNIRKARGLDAPLTDYQKNVICGTLLGDASLQFPSNMSRVPIYTTTHSGAQKDYSNLLANILGGRCVFRERYDKRTNKTYKSFDVVTPSNMFFLTLYDKLYKDRVKYPTEEFLEFFNEVSLAYWFMDDGYANQNTFFLCTDSFTLETCILLSKYIEEHLGLHFRVIKRDNNYRLRLIFDDREKFINLVLPHLTNDTKYKINVKIIFKPHNNNIKLTTDEFIRKALEVHGEKYDYSKVDYKNNRTKVCIICPEHGEFWQTPVTHNCKKKSGCPICARKKRILSRTTNK